MGVISVIKHNTNILVGDYQFADRVKEETFSRLTNCDFIPRETTNVKAFHTKWDWEKDNITFRNLKAYLREEIERYFKPGAMSTGERHLLKEKNFWANVYKKGDYAQSHCHKPSAYSFAYFVKAKWYHSPLVFTDSGRRIRPREGRWVAFPAYLSHHVPKHRYNDTRITLSGNFDMDLEAFSSPS